MLYCSYCDYCNAAKDAEEFDSCKKYLCNYTKSVIIPDIIEKSTVHPCMFSSVE